MRVVAATVHDVRAPTSRTLAGSDAVHGDPDYSAAYVELTTDTGPTGCGLAFTIGRGTEVVCAAIEALRHHVVGADLDDVTSQFGVFWRTLASDSQLRWLGPEKGVIHLATAAIVNALWDLWAKRDGKPVWRLVAELTPEQLVACVDFRYLTDVLTPDDALSMLHALAPGKRARAAALRRAGYPAYLTSAGWLGYSDDRVRALCRAARRAGWTAFKMKVGVEPTDDARRAALMREEIGDRCDLMADANQVWDVPLAITRVDALAEFGLRWIEEPTSPDDVLGHAAIRRALARRGIGVATGEHCANRVLFKQLFQAGAIDYCQVDACRLGGLNEVLAVLLLAARFGVPVCPHAGGLGLCEYVQHVSAIDYIVVSGALEHRVTEFADHCHEHFVAPARVRAGRYLLPEVPGFSVELTPGALAALAYPGGAEWGG